MMHASIAPTEQLGNRGSLTMSSREIGELTGSTHDNVLKAIRRLVSEGVVSANETPYIHPQNGQTYREFRLDYRNTMVVVSGYSAELRARIIDRWMELEAQVSAPPAAPKPALSKDAHEVLLKLRHMGGSASARDLYQRLKHRMASMALTRAAVEDLRACGLVTVHLRSSSKGGRPKTIVTVVDGSPTPQIVPGKVGMSIPSLLCPVEPLARAAEAVLQAEGAEQDKETAICAIERLVAQQVPTGASGALYQVILMQEAADRLHSWIPRTAEGAEISGSDMHRVNLMAAGISGLLSSLGGSLPELVKVYHSVPV